MAFEGFVRWTSAVVEQSGRIEDILAELRKLRGQLAPESRRRNIMRLQTEAHYFAIAAHQMIQYRDRVVAFRDVILELSKLETFIADDIKELRDMGEHEPEYIIDGRGHFKNRWLRATEDCATGASGISGTVIGGRLDWVAFSEAAKCILNHILTIPPLYDLPE